MIAPDRKTAERLASICSRPARRLVPTDAEGILDQYRELISSASSTVREKRFLRTLLARKAFVLPDEQEARLCSIIRKQALRRQSCAA
jgi:hypothetical protein